MTKATTLKNGGTRNRNQRPFEKRVCRPISAEMGWLELPQSTASSQPTFARFGLLMALVCRVHTQRCHPECSFWCVMGMIEKWRNVRWRASHGDAWGWGACAQHGSLHTLCWNKLHIVVHGHMCVIVCIVLWCVNDLRVSLTMLSEPAYFCWLAPLATLQVRSHCNILWCSQLSFFIPVIDQSVDWSSILSELRA